MYRNLESTERPLMPTKVLITYHHFLVFARHTYLRLTKKLRVISNKGLVRWTLSRRKKTKQNKNKIPRGTILQKLGWRQLRTLQAYMLLA